MIGNEQLGMIDWTTQGKSTRMVSNLRRKWVSTFVSGWCATGKNDEGIETDNIYSTILVVCNVIRNKSLFPYIYVW